MPPWERWPAFSGIFSANGKNPVYFKVGRRNVECGNENEKAGNRNELIDMLKSGKFFDEG
jgi:hypothetical protein